MLTQVFQYQEQPITFSKSGEVFINATDMAKPFGKKTTHFIDNAQTQEFKRVLEAKVGIPTLTIVRGGTNPGTWMHQKLALKFAAWLSPDFELWVYDRIEELLTTGKVALAPMSPEEMKLQVFRMLEQEAESLRQQNFLLSSAKELLEVENTSLSKTVNLLAPKAELYDLMHNGEGLYSTDSIANELGISSATKLNKILERDGIVKRDRNEDKWMLRAEYRGKGFSRDVPHKYFRKDNTEGVRKWMYWTGPGRLFIIERYTSTTSKAA
ncbi:phage antirepressor KilAC domain-containing protein [Nibribacter koreensis]|uniref:KilA-N domain-containing protein n=1 Tax=Nibribacter koreensis TaxID=1084519 RepID=A0ABP8FC15_9BACT